MTSGELLLTFVIALLVFGPNKLPMLANHLGKLFRFLNRLRVQLNDFWQEQMKEQQLLENTRKAEQADALYSKDETKP
ncbi:Sec-independent protein translocase subunit TatA/TatB [Legionella erythra]|uniref:TatB protein (Twin arginine translocation) n=1 Tax=Legionella erythra TaxID=448 RepID=A0A0W0TSH5_LEGER|nr:twin-arginine translocase TatA/TatE family subunit [Legionella erythra]KTC98580.1 TatB protein (twin arginine translocation) [Legionella erythra]